MLSNTPLLFLIPFLASSAALPTHLRRSSPALKALVNLTDTTTTTNSTSFNSTQSALTAVSVPFAACPIRPGELPAAGVVNNVSISPCTRGGSEEPCRFEAGKDYVISVNYTSFLNATMPRTTLIARDDTVLPSLEYPYSGQSFGGCGYTDCPISANVTSTYNYNFVTYESNFNFLTINMTQTLEGPSILCAGFYAQYLKPSPAANSSFVSNSTSRGNSSSESISSPAPTSSVQL